jgi:hypothetical protein
MMTSSKNPIVVTLCVVSAALLLVSGSIHLHLLRGPYRHVTTAHMNTLFGLQVISCVVLALALVALRNLLIVLASAGLMAGTALGFLISRYRSAGLFGWHIGFTSSEAKWTLIAEILATVVLLVTAGVMSRSKTAA